jgi:hypothetical protein
MATRRGSAKARNIKAVAFEESLIVTCLGYSNLTNVSMRLQNEPSSFLRESNNYIANPRVKSGSSVPTGGAS